MLVSDKLYFKFLLQCLILVSVLFCASKAFASHILVEGDANSPPYEYVENGEPKGFNIDIIKAVAEASGLHISINLRDWNEVVENLDKGISDVASGMYSSPDRMELFDFSMPHNIVSHSVFVRNGSDIQMLDDLHGKEIIVQRGDIMHDYALTHFPDAKVIPVTTQLEALKLLASGRHDAALLGKLQNLFHAHEKKLRNVANTGADFAFSKYCFAVKKGNAELLSKLNEGLVLIKKSGKYNEIYEKWFGVHERESIYKALIHYAVIILVPLILFLLLFILWVRMLRHKVRQKTDELRNELAERHRAETELKKVQVYLSNVIDSMPSVLIGVDKNCNVNQWNREAEKVFGSLLNDVIGMPLDIAVPELASEVVRVREALSTGEKQIDPKLRRYQGNRVRYEDVTIYPLTQPGVEGAVIRIDDITERMNLEQMIMQNEKMMSVGGLAAGMAHEINNPLAVIVGHAQNIRRRTSPEVEKNRTVAEECGTTVEVIQDYMEKRGVHRMIESILESGNRAAKIVVNMLSFSRKSDKVKVLHSIPDVLDRTLELASSDYDLKKKYDFKQIEVVREYDDALPVVCCEVNEIQQVFLNLFKNGAEAMQGKVYNTGGPRFVLRVKRVGDMLRIEVEDNGPGMDEDTRKRIFEPFYTTKEVGSGTGLGLSVSYFIITEHHSGTMEVDSLFGLWTRFIIKLPITGSECKQS